MKVKIENDGLVGDLTVSKTYDKAYLMREGHLLTAALNRPRLESISDTHIVLSGFEEVDSNYAYREWNCRIVNESS